MDTEILKWAEKREDLLKWLKYADENMEFGKVIIYYAEGKITKRDLCPRIREDIIDETEEV